MVCMCVCVCVCVSVCVVRDETTQGTRVSIKTITILRYITERIRIHLSFLYGNT